MKKLLLFTCFLLCLAACKNSGDGQLIGVSNKTKFVSFTPYGMVYIPSGNLLLGSGENDPSLAFAPQTRSVTLTSFWMDETEITNNEYRQFINWVRDSIAHVLLGDAEITEVEKYGHYLKYKKGENAGEIIEPRLINWKEEIPWNSTNEDVRQALSPLYQTINTRYYHYRPLGINAAKLNYEYWYFDYDAAAAKEKGWSEVGGMFTNRPSHVSGDLSRFIKRESVNVYPDTLVWIYEFSYSDNEHMTRNYFSHPQYSHYPVVGVNWLQCQAFCNWRSHQRNVWLNSRGYPIEHDFRLPTEAQWEWAARGGLQANPYPWGGPYPSNQNGCFLANFKPQRGNYTADGFLYPSVVAYYQPNDWGLYDMSGNVAEWCFDAYSLSASSFVSDINSIYKYNATDKDSFENKKKVVRGGSWKDISKYITVFMRDYQYQDTCTSYIGFRCIQPAIVNPKEANKGSGSKIYR
jgi:gliding motility-associated lipoprotein GldK